MVRSLLQCLQRPASVDPRSVTALVAAARDDNVPPCVVEIGAPVQAVVRTSDGHPLLWVWISPGASLRAELLSAIAGPRELWKITLDWKLLS